MEGGGCGDNGTSNGTHPQGAPLTVQELDVDVLPLVYDIVRSVERELQDCSLKVIELHEKLDSARAQIRRLPGIEHNKQEQLRQFEILRRQLRLKRDLLQKYRNMCSFDSSFQ